MSRERTTVVVLERGAAWPSCLASCRRDVPDTVVIAQDQHEHPSLLARRAESRLARLRAEGRPIEAAVLAVAPSSSRGALADPREGGEGRMRIARALLAALDAADGRNGTLWLMAPVALVEPARHELFALAGALTSLLDGSGVTIAVRFDDSREVAEKRPAESGLHALPAELAG